MHRLHLIILNIRNTRITQAQLAILAKKSQYPKIGTLPAQILTLNQHRANNKHRRAIKKLHVEMQPESVFHLSASQAQHCLTSGLTMPPPLSFWPPLPSSWFRIFSKEIFLNHQLPNHEIIPV